MLFLYFSGHGVSHENQDYLVPGDVRSLADALAEPQRLVRVDLSSYLKKCKARAVVFAVDACRDTMEPGKGVRLQAARDFGYGAVDPEHKTRIATIYGCDKEQFCYFRSVLFHEANERLIGAGNHFRQLLRLVLRRQHQAERPGEQAHPQFVAAHVARAAREVETTPEDVRSRLARYASYCHFTAPGEVSAT